MRTATSIQKDVDLLCRFLACNNEEILLEFQQEPKRTPEPLPLHIELIIDGMEERGLRNSIVAIGRYENFFTALGHFENFFTSRSIFKKTFLDMRDRALQRAFYELERSDIRSVACYNV